MDTNNSTPQRSTVPGQPPVDPSLEADVKKTDLYSAIAKNDEEVVVAPKKKRQSPFMFLVVSFMKATFYFDSMRRSNESLFHLLGGIWAGFMALLYLGGVVTLFLSLYARARLPLYLESFFEEYHLKYDTLKMADFSLAQIKVTNLHDEENRYIVPQLNIHSTFADFLQGRVRTATADGVQLNLKASAENGDNLGTALKILGMIANPMEAGLDLKINFITINNGVLNIEGKEKKVPVNFSMSGLYARDAQVIVRFTMDEDFLKMDSSLTVSGTADERELALTINSGTLSLANHHPEDIQGTVNVTASSDRISSVQSKINLNYGHNLKAIETQLTNSDKGFTGNMSFVLKNTSEENNKPLVDLALAVNDLSLSKDGKIFTDVPLQMTINRLVRNTTVLEGVEGVLNGELKCDLSQAECHYNLMKDAVISYQNLSIRYKEQNIVIDDSGSFSFLPTSDTLSFKLQDSAIGLNWKMAGVNLNGYYNTPSNLLRLSADTCQLTGYFSTQLDQDSFDAKVENGFYDAPNLTMKGINLTADDLYNPAAPIRFSAQEVQTVSPLLMKPVSVDMTYLDRSVKAEVRVKDADIVMTANGTLQPFQKTFSGQFKLFPVDLKTLPFELSELSTVFPKSLSNLSGKVAAAGQLNFAGSANISGPLFLGLENVRLNIKETPVGPVDGVIALQSLLPLVSAPNQNLFISKIDTLVPLTNVDVSFQLENQSIRLLGIKANLGDEELSTSSALIPYRKPSALLYLKTDKDFDINKFVSYMNLTGTIPSGGTGSLAIPIDVSENGIELTSVTFKVNNLTLKKSQTETDVLGVFDQGNKSYVARSGQLIFDRDNQLQVDLDGWLMPARKREAFAKKDVKLNAPLFKIGNIMSVPSKINNRQKQFFQNFTEESGE